MIRQVLVIVSLATLLTSCKQIEDNYRDNANYDKVDNISVYYGNFSAIHTENDIHAYISSRVTYKAEKGDHWQSPEETVALGTGDCEDFAILYMDIMYVRFGVKCDLVMVDTGRSVEAGGKFNHAVVRLPSGTLIDAESCRMVDYTARYSYTFDEVFGL